MGDSKRLGGLTPAEKFDANKFEYPVKFEVNKGTKTFKRYVEPKVDNAPSVSDANKSDNGNKIWKYFGIAVAVIIIGVIVAALVS